MRNNRMLDVLAAVLFLACLCTAQAVHAAKAVSGGKTTSYQESVTTTVFDTDSTGAQVLMRSDDYNASGEATFTTIANPTGAGNLVTSEIGPQGAWKLEMTSSSGRTVWVTPNDPLNSSQPAAPPAGYYAIINAYSACYDQNNNVVPFESLVNGSTNCSLAVDFDYNKIEYKLIMGPVLPAPGPATGLAMVGCGAASSGQCVNWTIVPNNSAPYLGVSNLYSFTGGSKQPWVYVGQYYNSFRINATYP